jgi:hypothetical protein
MKWTFPQNGQGRSGNTSKVTRLFDPIDYFDNCWEDVYRLVIRSLTETLIDKKEDSTYTLFNARNIILDLFNDISLSPNNTVNKLDIEYKSIMSHILDSYGILWKQHSRLSSRDSPLSTAVELHTSINYCIYRLTALKLRIIFFLNFDYSGNIKHSKSIHAAEKKMLMLLGVLSDYSDSELEEARSVQVYRRANELFPENNSVSRLKNIHTELRKLGYDVDTYNPKAMKDTFSREYTRDHRGVFAFLDLPVVNYSRARSQSEK